MSQKFEDIEIDRKFNNDEEAYSFSHPDGNFVGLLLRDSEGDEASVLFSQKELIQFVTDAVAMLRTVECEDE